MSQATLTVVDFLNFWFDPGDLVHLEPLVLIPSDDPTKKPRSKPKWQLREWREVGWKGQYAPQIDEKLWFPYLDKVNAAKASAYFGVNPVMGGGREFDMAHQIRKVNGLWADFDGTNDPEVLLAMFKAAGAPPPSCIVRSGGGAHTYHRFRQPYLITDAGPERPVKYAKREGSDYQEPYHIDDRGEKVWLKGKTIPLSPMAQALTDTLEGLYSLCTSHGVKADAVQNPNRLLRMPGSQNHKYDPPRPVEILYIEKDWKYDYNEFAELVADHRPKTSLAIHLVPPPEKRKLTRARQDQITDAKIDLTQLPVGQRSEKAFHLVALCYENGFSQEATWADCSPLEYFQEKGRKWFDLTWTEVVKNHAVQYVERRKKAIEATADREGLGPAPTADGVAAATPDREAIIRQSLLLKANKFCEHLQCEVVGEKPDGTTVLFSRTLGKTTEIKDLGRYSHANMVKDLGVEGAARIFDTADDAPGHYSTSEARTLIALLASTRPITVETHVGTGLWPVKEDGKEVPESILVGGMNSMVYDHKTRAVRPLNAPRYKDLTVSLSGDDSALWFDPATIAKDVALAADPENRRKLVEAVHGHFAQWKWLDAHASPGLLTGLIMASYVQTAWPWRPLVAILGPSASGKTLLLQQITGLFGTLAFGATMATEAAVRQGMGNQAKVIISDEFENNQHRAKLYELFRTASRGDFVIRGSASHKMQKFGLRHIPWVASIELGLDREPDRNRFIQLQTDRGGGHIELWDAAKLAFMRRLLLSCSVWCLPDALETAAWLCERHQDMGVDRRIVENYAVPFAMLAVGCGLPQDQTLTNFENLIGVTASDLDHETDDKGYLGAVLRLLVDLGQGQRRSIAEIISGDLRASQAALEAMERSYGVSLTVKRKQGERADRRRPHDASPADLFLFVAGGRLKDSGGLRGNRFADQSANEILCRLPGAEKGFGTVAKSQQRGVYVPFPWIKEELLEG